LGRDVDLYILPQVLHAQEELKPVITRAIVNVLSADQKLRFSKHFSVTLLDARHFAIHFEEDRQADQQIKDVLKSGQQLAVAVLLGGDPAVEIAHFGKMPATFDPMLICSLFCERPLDVVPCRTIPLFVPTDTEIVIEGLIDPRLEHIQIPGCIQSHGYVSSNSLQPIVQVQAITHRANPIYPDLVRGLPFGEEYYLTKFWEQIMLQFLQLIHPEILDISFPASGVPEQLLFVKLEKRKPYHARQILNFLWSWEFPLTPRTIIVVDQDVDLKMENDVWKSVVTNTDYGRDLVLQSAAAELMHGVPTNSPVTTRLGIDATRKWSSEGYAGTWPKKASFPLSVIERVQDLILSLKSS
jgi:4-hydroxy-3-polyprenylbenzoate decarboxylase